MSLHFPLSISSLVPIYVMFNLSFTFSTCFPQYSKRVQINFKNGKCYQWGRLITYIRQTNNAETKHGRHGEGRHNLRSWGEHFFSIVYTRYMWLGAADKVAVYADGGTPAPSLRRCLGRWSRPCVMRVRWSALEGVVRGGKNRSTFAPWVLNNLVLFLSMNELWDIQSHYSTDHYLLIIMPHCKYEYAIIYQESSIKTAGLL